MEFKDILRKRRDELGLTLEEVGNAVGVARATVQRWESGDIKNIRRDKIYSLSQVLKVSPLALLGRETEYTSEFNPNKNDETISLTKHERQLVLAYRANPAMQGAIDKLLNIPEENSIGKDISDTVRDVNNMFSKKV